MNRLSVTTDRGSQWKYSLLVLMVSNNKPNIINLTRDSDTELHVDFTKEMLPVNGRYIMQFEYTDGNVVGHTDKFDAFVNDVINTEDTWVDIPSEFEQLRQEIMQNAIIAQNAANEAKKISQEIKVESDKATQAAKDAQQYAQQAQQAVDLTQEAQRLAQEANQAAQEAKNQAVLSATEAEQSATQASQSKTEAAESATQANQAKVEAEESATQASQSATQANLSKDEAKKAQLASEKARDESQAILEQIQSIKVEVDGIVAQINDARDKALQAIETNKNSAVESVNNAGTNNVANVNQAGATQVEAVNDAGVEQVQAVTNEGNKQVGLVTSEGTKQVQAVTTEGTNQLQSIRNEGSKQVQSITTEGTTQVKNVSDEGGKQVKAVNDAGAIQTANAKEQADRAKTEADRAEKSAEDAKTAAERAETMIDDTSIVRDRTWSSRNIVDMLCPPIDETGNPVVCTPVAGYPLSITASWGPTQEGVGDPSPENIRPIKGRNSVTAERCGENLLPFIIEFDDNIYAHEYYENSEIVRFFRRLPPGTYSYNADVTGTASGVKIGQIRFYDGNTLLATCDPGMSFSITEPHRCKTVLIYGSMSGATLKNAMIFVGTKIPTVYRPYTGQTTALTLPSTVYGGEVDAVSGKGQEMWKLVTLMGEEGWAIRDGYIGIYNLLLPVNAGNAICTHFAVKNNYNGDCLIVTGTGTVYLGTALTNKYTVDTWCAYLAAQYAAGTPVQIAYQVAEPTPFTATGNAPITALDGTNTIMTDADSVTVTGRADPTAYYGKKIAEISAAIVAR